MRFLAIFALVLVTITPLLCSDYEDGLLFTGTGNFSSSGVQKAVEVSLAAQPPRLSADISPSGILVYPLPPTNQGALQPPPLRLQITPPPPLGTSQISPHLRSDDTTLYSHPFGPPFLPPPVFGSLASRASAAAEVPAAQAPKTGLAGSKRGAEETLPPPPAPTLNRSLSAQLMIDVVNFVHGKSVDASDSWTPNQKAFFLLVIGKRDVLCSGTLNETTDINSIRAEIEILNYKDIGKIMQEFRARRTGNTLFQNAKHYMNYFITEDSTLFQEKNLQGTFYQYLKHLYGKYASRRLDQIIGLAQQHIPIESVVKPRGIGAFPLESLNKIFSEFDAKRYDLEVSTYEQIIFAPRS